MASHLLLPLLLPALLDVFEHLPALDFPELLPTLDLPGFAPIVGLALLVLFVRPPPVLTFGRPFPHAPPLPTLTRLPPPPPPPPPPHRRPDDTVEPPPPPPILIPSPLPNILENLLLLTSGPIPIPGPTFGLLALPPSIIPPIPPCPNGPCSTFEPLLYLFVLLP